MAAYGTMEGVIVNRAFKDTIFRDLFGSESRKANTLSLYNALNGSSYTNLDDLVLTTIENAVFMGYKDDVSFLVDNTMVLWEHQSTWNPNMPLRGLMYFAQLYGRVASGAGGTRYSSRRLPLPTPRYYVFYNGMDDRPDRDTLRLSDSFAHGSGDVEVTVTVLNVNEGHNTGIMEACETLAGYSHLIGTARHLAHAMEPGDAIAEAIRRCIEAGFLRDYLVERRSEVISSFLTEWDEAEYRAVLKEEAREDGLAEGRAEGRAEGLEEGRAEGRAEGLEEGRREGEATARDQILARVANLYQQGSFDLAMAAQILGITEEEALGVLTQKGEGA